MKFHGDVVSWNQEKGVGFIKYGFEEKSVLFRFPGVQRDWKGSRVWSTVVGTPVTFEIGERRRPRGDLQKVAINITPLFRLEEPQDLREIREISLVTRVNFDFGFLKRPCGDELFFHISDVIPGFEPYWDDIKVCNVPIFHGVSCDLLGRWRADCIALYSPAEIELWRNPPPPEPEPEPAPAIAAPQSEIFAPENRGKSLIEIIAAKRRTK